MYSSVWGSRAACRNTTMWLLAFCWAVTLNCPVAEALTLTGVKLSKTHGSAGTFEIPVDVTKSLDGAVTVESRAIGASLQFLFQFDGPIAAPGIASVTDVNGVPVGTATAIASVNDIVVTLTGIVNSQRITVTLTNVNGSVTFGPVSVGFLVGDVNNSGSVNSIDLSSVKSRSGQTTTAANFKFDVNASGAINSSDISAVKARLGLVLPVAMRINSLSALSAAPLTLLNISGSGFDPSLVLKLGPAGRFTCTLRARM